eukprot:4327-Heterococcus_DN1.PRE.2
MSRFSLPPLHSPRSLCTASERRRHHAAVLCCCITLKQKQHASLRREAAQRIASDNRWHGTSPRLMTLKLALER